MIFPPFFGEFGWLIMSHLRHVHAYKAQRKIVCCQPGEECLYPSATDFFTNWKHPIPDDGRCGTMAHNNSEIMIAAHRAFPNQPVAHLNYDCHWHLSSAVKFKPVARQVLPSVDIVCGVRNRRFGSEANWRYWNPLIKYLRQLGYLVGLAGKQDTSFELEADVRAWDHQDGPTAGTVDLLTNCRLYIGTDSGVSHLAALMDTPMIAFYFEHPGRPDQTGLMRRSNKNLFHRLPNFVWNDPEKVLGAVISLLLDQNVR